MNAIKELSTVVESDFPEAWYDITADGHFWIEWRFQAFLSQLKALRIPLDVPWRGLDVRDIRYWGCSMLPYLVARKLMTAGTSSSEQAIACGLPSKPWLNDAICRIMRVECALVPNPPLGTSLLAAAVKKPTRAHGSSRP